MRPLLPLLLVFAASLVTSLAQAEMPAGAAGSFLTLAGHATTRQRSALPADAVFHLKARDGQRTLAEQEIPLEGRQVPIPFQATVDRDLIGPKSRLVLEGRITRGQRTLYAGSAAAGHETTQILLKPVAGPKTPKD